MATQFKIASLSEFLISYERGLKSTAPVKTGRLRDSIAVLRPTLADIFTIPTNAVDYAFYANKKHHFVEKNDYQLEDFADDALEAIWDDFYNENKTPNT